MKRIILVILLAGIAIASPFAQQFDNPQILARVGLTEPEIERVTEIWVETEQEIHVAQLELNILKAQLQKLLFPADADLKAIEKVIRASSDWKITSELAVIRRRVLIRQVFGEDRWVKFLRLQQQLKQKQEADQRRPAEGRSAPGQ